MSQPKSVSDAFVSSLTSSFARTDNHTSFSLFTQGKALFPAKQHVFVEDCGFDLTGFLASQGHPPRVCEGEEGGFKRLDNRVSLHGSLDSEITQVLKDGSFAFTHKGVAFHVLHASWIYPHGQLGQTYHVIFDGADDKAGRDFVKDVYDWQAALKDEIWVFTQGHWSKDKALYSAIQTAQWDDVILEERLISRLKANTETFFASKEIYRSLNVPWKRGVLLLGPPGNGKTQTIQVLLKDAIAKGIRCLYVKSFEARQGPEFGIRTIFQLARKQAPCIMVLEDLDAMVKDEVRSFFLNELDGLERNEGILTIATTNHPERIDDAIIRRPSRFDQKYNFDLPTFQLRERYIVIWIGKIAVAGKVDFSDKPSDELAKQIAEKTEDWSFAFLKELFLSFLLRSAHDLSFVNIEGDETGSSKTATDILLEQVDVLAEQVARGGLPIGAEPDMQSERGGASVTRRMMGMMPVSVARPAYRA